jgi:hypothetical protein
MNATEIALEDKHTILAYARELSPILSTMQRVLEFAGHVSAWLDRAGDDTEDRETRRAALREAYTWRKVAHERTSMRCEAHQFLSEADRAYLFLAPPLSYAEVKRLAAGETGGQ